MQQQPAKHTYIADPENPAEMSRLTEQDRLVTAGMGGLFPELGNTLPSTIVNIMDVGCGPGAWVLDTAFSFPDREVIGIDISEIMINYARARAKTQGLNNAIFMNANILEPLEFADGEFDLVNCRFAVGFLHRDKWPDVLREFCRVLRPGGTLRLTEPLNFGDTNSPAINRLAQMLCQLFHLRGYGFASQVDAPYTYGIINILPDLLTTACCDNIKTNQYVLDISYGTVFHGMQIKNYELVFDLLQGQFFQHGLITKEDFDVVIDRVRFEGQKEDFRGTWQHVTAWGQKSIPQPE